MARPTWTGSISFGLVSVGVKAFTAVRDHDIHFHQLSKKSGARIRNKKIDEDSGREVDSDDIQLGFEISNGRYVTFEHDEVAELRPRSTRAIDVTDFVSLDEIDPVFYERTYWLAPDGDTAAKPYALLLAAMMDRNRAAIGTVVMRNKQYLAAIRPLDGALAMSTMRFADEVVAKSDIDLPKSAAKPDAKQLKMATQLVDALSSSWDPGQYRDTFTEELRKIIETKDAGKDVVEHEPEESGAKVIDLMEALQASLAATKKSGTKSATKATSNASGSKASGSKASASKASRSTKSGGKKKPAASKAGRKSA